MVYIYSYGAKHNEPALRTMVLDRVYPCHNIVNPYNSELRSLTGLDEDVQVLIWSDDVAKRIYSMAMREVNEGFTKVAFECYGGRHRSVAMAEILAEALQESHEVQIHHLSLGRY